MARLSRSAFGVGAMIFFCAALAECSALDGLTAAADPDAADVYRESDDADADGRTQGADASAADTQVLE